MVRRILGLIMGWPEIQARTLGGIIAEAERAAAVAEVERILGYTQVS